MAEWLSSDMLSYMDLKLSLCDAVTILDIAQPFIANILLQSPSWGTMSWPYPRRHL